MKRLFVIVLMLSIICIAPNASHAQFRAKTYGGSSSDNAWSIQQTADNGYIVAGSTNSFGAGYADAWLLKLDSSGIVQWQKTYGGSRGDGARSVQQTSDNGYIVAGSTNSFGAGDHDIWLLKLDNNGIVQWQKTYGGSSSDTAWLVQQTNDNGYIVAGSTESLGAGAYDGWLLKIDSSGTIQWQKTYGSTSNDETFSVQQTGDNGYIVVGRTESFGAGDYDIWLLKLDNSGIVQWQKTYGGSNYDTASSAQQTNDGGYILAGYTESFGYGFYGDGWLLKLDSSGIVQWQKTYGGTTDDYTNLVQQTIDYGYIVVGQTFSFGAGYGDGWMLKLDSNGTIQWQKRYGEIITDAAFSLLQTSDNGYIVAGSTNSFGAGGSDYDVWVLKLDSSGNIPGCNIIGTSDALVTETTAVGESTSITASDSSATINDTLSLPQDTSCTSTEVCPLDVDSDEDAIPDSIDNCPNTPNVDQLDTCPPQGNNIGDACDCECDFNCTGGVDANDVTAFLGDFGRSTFNNPCTNATPCNGDVDCNANVDALDVNIFLEDFGRSQFNNPCPACVVGDWCVYP